MNFIKLSMNLSARNYRYLSYNIIAGLYESGAYFLINLDRQPVL